MAHAPPIRNFKNLISTINDKSYKTQNQSEQNVTNLHSSIPNNSIRLYLNVI